MSSLHAKLLDVQKKCHALNLVPAATGQVQSRNYKYLTIQALHEAVLPVLHEAGLTWTCVPTVVDGEPVLKFSLSDGESDIGGTCPLIGVSDMQKLGSAVTYARRYALLAVLGLVPDLDDDGAGASERKSTAPQTERSAVPTIPLDRAKKILAAAQEAGLAEGTTITPGLAAKLTEVGVTSQKIGHLNVDQAEAVEAFIAKEVAA